MPWNVDDVKKHNQAATTPKLKRVWVSAANNALSTCERDGGRDCEGRAIRIANAAVKRAMESYVAPSLIQTLLPQNSPLKYLPLTEALLTEAISLLAQDDSYSARLSAVDNAVHVWARMHALTIAADTYGSASYAYAIDLYDDVVIFRWNSQLWRASYSIDSENKVTLGDPERVKLYYAPVNVTSAPSTDDEMASWREVEEPVRLFISKLESDSEEVYQQEAANEEMLVESDCVPFTEAAVADDGTAKICVITPGWGSSGYYSAQMLERDAATVFPKGTHMHWDHPTIEEMNVRPEGTLDSLAGVLQEDAYWDVNGSDGPGVYANVKVFEEKREVLEEIAPYIGVSIKAPGMAKEGTIEGRKGKIIESLLPRKTNAVDFVTIPGRGGRILDLVESARTKVIGPVTRKTEHKKREDDMDKEQIEALVAESVKNAVTAAVTEATADANKKIVELTATIERQSETIRTRDMREVAAQEVAKYNQLGERARKRVLEMATVGEAPLTETNTLDVEKIRESVKKYADDEIEYLKAEAGDTGRVRRMGASAPVSESTSNEDVEKALKEAAKALGLGEKETEIFAAGR